MCCFYLSLMKSSLVQARGVLYVGCSMPSIDVNHDRRRTTTPVLVASTQLTLINSDEAKEHFAKGRFVLRSDRYWCGTVFVPWQCERIGPAPSTTLRTSCTRKSETRSSGSSTC